MIRIATMKVATILTLVSRGCAGRLFSFAFALTVLAAALDGAAAGPKLLVVLEQGTGLIGGPAPEIAGATVTATALMAEGRNNGETTVGATNANGELVLEVPAGGAYAIEIQLEGANYWTSRRVLLDARTELTPGAALSSDEFSPIRDYTEVSCGTAAQDGDTHPIREILLGRLSVLRTEIDMHRNAADTLARTQLSDAPQHLRSEITTALATNGTTAEIFHALTPIRQRSGLPDPGAGTNGRDSDQNNGDAPPPSYATSVEKIWLLYFLAARATADLDTLYGNLKDCGGSVVAEAPEAGDGPVTQQQDTAPTPKQDQLAPPVHGRVAPRQAYQPPQPGTSPAPVEAANHNWTGFYVGGHLGAGFADAGYRAGIAGPPVPINVDADGILGGVLVGYNLQYDRMVFGVEGDISFGDLDGRSTLAGLSNPLLKTDYIATARARLGYAWEKLLVYGHIGIGFAAMQVEESLQLGASTQSGNTHVGVVVGAGVEWALTDAVSLRTEYIYGNFDRRNYTVGAVTDSLAFDVHIARAALTVQLGLLP